ncbi:uncharacterized protein LOC34623665 [Cyclospora cayetanensis]|uniref:Alkyl transferase n=1 Tax=Cyclospora cayetanensis TaxID=88456 RepID=A0A6P6S123_9EIME|nr:uncharacterized protein LOC34623665 [Cyclospora cayetanensis]
MLNWFDRLLCWVLSGGSIPLHVAFVMDGNRRFARKKMQSAWKGHAEGAEALKKIATACAAVGIRVVSVYGFALGNFHRTPEEVEGLLGLAEAIFKDPDWIQGFLMSERIRLVVVGDLSFVGDRLREAAAAAERETAGNDRLLLRLCVSYGARHEVHRITSPLHLENEGSGSAAPQWAALSKAEQHSSRRGAAAAVCAAAAVGLLHSQLGTAFFMALQGGNCPLPDMLIRTSGEARLSDFLLCEVSEGCFFHFVPVLWPDGSRSKQADCAVVVCARCSAASWHHIPAFPAGVPPCKIYASVGR